MAYKSNDKTMILGSIPKNKRGDEICVSHIDGDSGISYDIRQTYRNDADERCYTQKGVRMTEEDMAKLIILVMKDFSVETYNHVIEALSEDSEPTVVSEE